MKEIEKIENESSMLLKNIDDLIKELRERKVQLVGDLKKKDSRLVGLIKSKIDHSNDFVENGEILFFLQQVEPDFKDITINGLGRFMAGAGFVKGKINNKRGWYCYFDDSELYG